MTLGIVAWGLLAMTLTFGWPLSLMLSLIGLPLGVSSRRRGKAAAIAVGIPTAGVVLNGTLVAFGGWVVLQLLMGYSESQA